MSGRMMNYRKYYESLEKMNDPVMPSQLSPMPNMKNVSAYAKATGKNWRVDKRRIGAAVRSVYLLGFDEQMDASFMIFIKNCYHLCLLF